MVGREESGKGERLKHRVAKRLMLSPNEYCKKRLSGEATFADVRKAGEIAKAEFDETGRIHYVYRCHAYPCRDSKFAHLRKTNTRPYVDERTDPELWKVNREISGYVRGNP